MPIGLSKGQPGMKVRKYRSKKPCVVVNGNAKNISSLGYSNSGLSQNFGGVIEQMQANSIINAMEINSIRSCQSS